MAEISARRAEGVGSRIANTSAGYSEWRSFGVLVGGCMVQPPIKTSFAPSLPGSTRGQGRWFFTLKTMRSGKNFNRAAMPQLQPVQHQWAVEVAAALAPGALLGPRCPSSRRIQTIVIQRRPKTVKHLCAFSFNTIVHLVVTS